MEKINFESVIGDNGKETAQRIGASMAGTAAFGAVTSAAATVGCGSVLCTVGAPAVIGLAAAAGAAKTVGWVWDSLFD